MRCTRPHSRLEAPGCPYAAVVPGHPAGVRLLRRPAPAGLRVVPLVAAPLRVRACGAVLPLPAERAAHGIVAPGRPRLVAVLGASASKETGRRPASLCTRSILPPAWGRAILARHGECPASSALPQGPPPRPRWIRRRKTAGRGRPRQRRRRPAPRHRALARPAGTGPSPPRGVALTGAQQGHAGPACCAVRIGALGRPVRLGSQ